MFEVMKEKLANFWKWVRQHWKGVLAFLLACLAFGLVMAFPLTAITLIGSSALFEAIVDMELVLYFLEIPLILMIATGITALLSFMSVIAATSLFNLANHLYDQVDEHFFRPLIQNQTIVAVLIVVAVVSLALIAAFAGGLWFIPAIVVAIPVINKVVQMLDRKINPRCDLITLPASVAPEGPIPEDIVKKMHYGRYSFMIGHGRSYFKCGENTYQATWNRRKGNYFFEPVLLAGSNELDKLRSEKFKAIFPLPNEKKPKEVVYGSMSYLDIDRKAFVEKGPLVMPKGGAAVRVNPIVDIPTQRPTLAPIPTIAPTQALPPPIFTVTQAQTVVATPVQVQGLDPTQIRASVATSTTTTATTTTTHALPSGVAGGELMRKSRSASDSNRSVYPNRNATFKEQQPVNDARPATLNQATVTANSTTAIPT